jgi:hypothetical protein
MREKHVVLLVLALSFVFFAGCDMSVNRSIRVGDGDSAGRLTSVNGSIHVGARCRVEGECQTVNGSIHVGEASRVRGLDTVNGRIELAAGVDVDGDAATVNGSVLGGAGSKIHGNVGTVNGRIELKNCEVDEDLSTVNGDIDLLAKSLVRGDIVIKGRHGNLFNHPHLNIRIGDGSRVEGGIFVRDAGITVKVYLGRDASVKGEIRNAEVIKE